MCGRRWHLSQHHEWTEEANLAKSLKAEASSQKSELLSLPGLGRVYVASNFPRTSVHLCWVGLCGAIVLIIHFHSQGSEVLEYF